MSNVIEIVNVRKTKINDGNFELKVRVLERYAVMVSSNVVE